MHFMSATDIRGEENKRYAFFICADCDLVKYKKIDLTKPNDDDDFY
jgi:hypothetical protein